MVQRPADAPCLRARAARPPIDTTHAITVLQPRAGDLAAATYSPAMIRSLMSVPPLPDGDVAPDGTVRFAALSMPAAPWPVGDAGRDGSREHEYMRMLRTLLGNISGMVYRCRDDSHWTMDFVSGGCLELTGFEVDELLRGERITYELITHPDDRARVRHAIGQALAAGGRFDLEYRIVRADGELRWVWDRGTGVHDPTGQLLAIEGLVQDISERKQAEQALREAEGRYRGLFENAIEGVFRTTPDGVYVEANPALAAIYGYETPAALMDSVRDIGSQLYVDPARREQFMRIMREQGEVHEFESQVYRRDGGIIWIAENARAVRGAEGEVLYYEGMVEDITDRKTYQHRLEWQATHDSLTGLANRVLLQERLELAIHRAAADDAQVAVIFVDLDHFKLINDTMGHAIGDEMLRTLARRLRLCVRGSDTIARHGGDEFVLVTGCGRGPQPAARVIELLVQAIAEPCQLAGREYRLNCSVGVALYPGDGRTAETLLKHADSALYRAKANGRNNVQFFTRGMTAGLAQRLEMENNLRRALEHQHFELHYQPRVDLTIGRIVGAEALLRWRDPVHGLIMPDQFIPLAEETGLVVPLGNWVLQAACAQLRRWQEAGLRPGFVSVNVSAQQFFRADLPRVVAQVLADTGVDAADVELEITESVAMHDAPRLLRTLQELKALGVRVSIDDFGTGYSSLAYLRRFPVDSLKIDRSFVSELGADADDAIVRSIVALGHSLGLKVVAEGVELETQLLRLRNVGCDEVQGYYFGRPAPAAEHGERLQAGMPRPRRTGVLRVAR